MKDFFSSMVSFSFRIEHFEFHLTWHQDGAMTKLSCLKKGLYLSFLPAWTFQVLGEVFMWMCDSRKYPYPPHGWSFSLNPPPHPPGISIPEGLWWTPHPPGFSWFFFSLFFLKPSQIFSIVCLNKSGITFLVYTQLFNNYSTHSFCLTTVQYFVTQCIVHSRWQTMYWRA